MRLLISVAVAIIAVIAGLLGFVHYHGQLQVTPRAAATASTGAQLRVTSVSTSSPEWTSFASSTLGISFQYPSSYDLTISRTGGTEYNIGITASRHSGFVIGEYPVAETTLAEWLSAPGEPDSTLPTSYGFIAQVASNTPGESISSTTIDGVEALMDRFDCAYIATSPGVAHGVDVMTVVKGRFYEFSAQDICSDSKSLDIFLQLLRTVKFQ